jgi:hypothetical protein
MFMM